MTKKHDLDIDDAKITAAQELVKAANDLRRALKYDIFPKEANDRYKRALNNYKRLKNM